MKDGHKKIEFFFSRFGRSGKLIKLLLPYYNHVLSDLYSKCASTNYEYEQNTIVLILVPECGQSNESNTPNRECKPDVFERMKTKFLFLVVRIFGGK